MTVDCPSLLHKCSISNMNRAKYSHQLPAHIYRQLRHHMLCNIVALSANKRIFFQNINTNDKLNFWFFG
jgi:hypothetical protein